jgi:serine/threonine protein kinase
LPPGGASCAYWGEGPLRGRARVGRPSLALDYLAHPVIVRSFAAVLEGSYPHLLLEQLEGPTLRRVINRGGPVPLEQALQLAAHVAAALSYMPRMEIVHLDLKPDTIVMGVRRLIDLSIARPRACLPRPKPTRHRRIHGARAVRSDALARRDRPGAVRRRAISTAARGTREHPSRGPIPAAQPGAAPAPVRYLAADS